MSGQVDIQATRATHAGLFIRSGQPDESGDVLFLWVLTTGFLKLDCFVLCLFFLCAYAFFAFLACGGLGCFVMCWLLFYECVFIVVVWWWCIFVWPIGGCVGMARVGGGLATVVVVYGSLRTEGGYEEEKKVLKVGKTDTKKEMGTKMKTFKDELIHLAAEVQKLRPFELERG
ncbi:hypothetical protein VNO78_07785 [Psophocarpus tetragonolobus]|uniref:Uncharacterized protein n=1 Tax=Psophocarpus tetragonolobus TaxID=3891 RepID=A0AAN9XS79_PSOTE